MNLKELDELLQRYDEGKCTAEEKERVEKVFNAMRTTSDELSPEVRAHMQRRLWTKLEDQINEKQTPVLSWKSVSIAAAVLVLFVCGIYLITPNSSHQTATTVLPGEHASKKKIFYNSGTEPKKVNLTDGSSIVVKPGGKLIYPTEFSQVREVTLEGEAFFEIARDTQRPFVVYTNGLTTKVLGTSFIIKANKGENEILVAVRTGRVEVNTQVEKTGAGSHSGQALVLTPNQQVTYNRAQNIVQLALVEKPQPIQQPRYSNYTNASVVDILKSLENCYGVEIRFDENVLSNCTITSNMSQEGLYEQVEIICNAIGARYTVSELTIAIEGRGCK